MVMQVFAWIVLITIAAIMLSRRPVRNCQSCKWRMLEQCKHPTASRVPELPEIQVGMWRCPWRELANNKRDLMIDGGSDYGHSGLNRSHSSNACVALHRVVGPENNGPTPTAEQHNAKLEELLLGLAREQNIDNQEVSINE